MHAFMHETYQVCVKCRPGAATACSWKPQSFPGSRDAGEATPWVSETGQGQGPCPLQRQGGAVPLSPVVHYRHAKAKDPDWGC